MIKKSSRIKNEYADEKLCIKEIYSRNMNRLDRSKYLLSVDVMLGKERHISAKSVCVHNKANRKDGLVFVCTGMSLSEEEFVPIASD